MTKASKEERARRAREALDAIDSAPEGRVVNSPSGDLPERSGGGSPDNTPPRRRTRVLPRVGDEGGGYKDAPISEPRPAAAPAADTGNVRPERAEPEPISPSHFPKKYKPEDLKVGTPVFYRGERYWIEHVQSEWSKGCYVRISDTRVNPDPNVKSGSGLCYVDAKGNGHGNVVSLCVHADLVALAPSAKNPYARQPTLSDVARKERTARGERDVGDDVAVLLRSAKTLDDTYRIGAKFLATPEADLRKKYGHLNPGQQRMNIGNRMRAKWRKSQR